MSLSRDLLQQVGTVKAEGSGAVAVTHGMNCSLWSYAERKKIGRGSRMNRTSIPPDDPIGEGTELNHHLHPVWYKCVHTKDAT